MIESYGKFVALDGSEYVYTDFKDSRKEAVAKAEARDQAIAPWMMQPCPSQN